MNGSDSKYLNSFAKPASVNLLAGQAWTMKWIAWPNSPWIFVLCPGLGAWFADRIHDAVQ